MRLLLRAGAGRIAVVAREAAVGEGVVTRVTDLDQPGIRHRIDVVDRVWTLTRDDA